MTQIRGRHVLHPTPLCAAAALTAALLVACASPPKGARKSELSPVERAARVQQLVSEIRAEQRRVIDSVSADTVHSPSADREDPAIRAAAERLPALQRELRSLDGEAELLAAPAALP